MAEEFKMAELGDFKNWVHGLTLLIDDIRASISYDSATSFCSICPGRDGNCCKDTGAWDRQYESDFEYLDKLEAAKKAIAAIIVEGE